MDSKSSKGIMPSLTVDCVIFGLSEKQLKVLIVKHALAESDGEWALPGGYIEENESLEDAASRILNHLTGVHDVYLEQLQAFSDVDRVGDKRVISFTFYALVQPEHHELAVPANTLDASWCNVEDTPDLIFDHNQMVNAGIANLRRKIRHEPIGVNLLPPKFTLGQFQELYEAILNTKLDKPNFRRKMLRMNFLVCCNETQEKVPHRAGTLYRFDPKVYQELCGKGFNFEF